MKNNSFTVAVLGAGNIGSAVIERLLEVDNEVLNLSLSKVLVSDLSKERDIDGGLLTTDFDEILNDENIDLVIEVLGGVEPGKGYIKDLLESGKSVITANKDIVADCGSELIQIAQKNNVCLYFEAAVAGSIPVLKSLKEGLVANEVSKIYGILNLSLIHI